MYDLYMPPHATFHPVTHGDDPSQQEKNRFDQRANFKPHQKPPGSDLLGDLTGGIKNFLGSVFTGFSLENLDSGDILLLLIILFLYLEGANLDLVIALGIMLLLGFGNTNSTAIPPNEGQSHPEV